MSAGRMQHRIRFESREIVSDGYGNHEGDFDDRFTRWAEIRPSSGIETVNAARLQGRQPVDIIVYRDSETKLIDANWRAVDVREGTIYAITAPPFDMEQTRRRLTIKAESGVAA